MIESPTQTPPEPRRRRRFPRLSGRTKTIIALVVIALAVVAAFFAPPEGDSNNITGDPPPGTPTVTITNPVGSMSVHHAFTVQGVHFAVTQVQEAQKFSDDRQRGGNYVVRVWLTAHNPQQQVAGVKYESLVRLQLADGMQVAPKYISLAPSFLPGSSQQGYFDFPVPTTEPLTSLSLHFGTQIINFSS